MPHTLPKLPYEYAALEPHIDAKTMEIHHTKHHQAYIDKLNAGLEKHPELSERSLEDLLADIESVPKDIQTVVRNNGGGHLNHSFFWKLMSPAPKKEPEGELKSALESAFGSMEDFKKKFEDEAMGRFGSGWAWLAIHTEGKLVLYSTPNQDSPIMLASPERAGGKIIPIIGLDVWEHAYYLSYQNRRGDYIKAWWNVLDWAAAETQFNLK